MRVDAFTGTTYPNYFGCSKGGPTLLQIQNEMTPGRIPNRSETVHFGTARAAHFGSEESAGYSLDCVGVFGTK